MTTRTPPCTCRPGRACPRHFDPGARDVVGKIANLEIAGPAPHDQGLCSDCLLGTSWHG